MQQLSRPGFSYPRSSPKSPTYQVLVNGQDTFVYHTSAGDFVSVSGMDTPVVDVIASRPFHSARIAPARHAIAPDISGNRCHFTVNHPAHILVESPGLPPLYVFVDEQEEHPPRPDAPGVHYYRAGQVYEVGELRLASNETLYIEGGAVIRGCIRATSATNIRIAGRGVLDGSYYQQGIDSHRSIVLEDCQHCVIEDIVMVEPSSWMIVLGACSDILVKNVKELGEVVSSDGIDIVGSRHIRVENCFCRNGDDCIAIKSLDLRPHDPTCTLDYSLDVEDIEVRGCQFLAYRGSQALEIGHELRTPSVRNIRFIDCDILGVHDFGAPFGIHNADRAVIQDVVYENIRVEHHYDKLIDFRIVRTRWSQDAERGQVCGVLLKNIDVAVSIYNAGYTCSLIGGYDPNHTIEQVRFEDFRMNGAAASGPDDLDLYLRHSHNLTFSADGK